MSKTKEITKFCEEYLKVEDYKDYCHNGMQVEGAAEVNKIITGVSFSQKLIEAAIERKAQMIIVHHGMFSGQFGELPVIKGAIKNRLKILLNNEINLLGFHLPLDAHIEIGNNASLARLLGVENLKPVDVGFVGDLNAEMSIEDFVKAVENKLNAKTINVLAGTKLVKKIGIISGGASNSYHDMLENGADTFLCGDLRENVVREAEEVGINIINAGHYNTEKLGVQNLGNLIAEKFGIEVEFVDVPNSI